MRGGAVVRISPPGRAGPLDPVEAGPLEDTLANVRSFRRLLASLLEPYGLLVPDYQAMRLASQGGTRPTDVSLHAAISPGATTELLDRLEARGLITRSPDPNDRRSTQIALTRKGERLYQEAAAAKRELLEEVIEAMSKEGLAALQRGAHELRTILDRRRADVAQDR